MTKEMQTTPPLGDQVGHIETNGTNIIPESDYHGHPRELFWVWFAGNMALFVLVYGAIVAANQLNLWQGALVVLVGAGGSYALVGVLSLPGIRFHKPTLAISTLSFGTRGNILPAAISWLSLIGWEVFSNVLVTYTLLALFNLAGMPTTVPLTIVCLGIGTGLAVGVGILGHATLVWSQRAITASFGILTLLLGGYLLLGTNGSAVLATAPAPWDNVLVALIIVAAGTGVTWFNTASDYTRYLPQTSSKPAVVLWTTAGSLAVVLPLMIVGFFLVKRVPALLTASNPIAAIGTILPPWTPVHYLFLITAIVGLLASAVIGLYSSGLSFLAMGIHMPRYQSIWIDGALVFAGTALILAANSFIAAFESLLLLIAVPLTAWAAIFCIDAFSPGHPPQERPVNWLATVVLPVSTGVGLLFTKSPPVFTGPLAVGIFGAASFGYVISAVVSGVLYASLRPLFTTSRPEDGTTGKEVQ